jgi:predicted DNA-binding protein (MmcQ/YjbR family)
MEAALPGARIAWGRPAPYLARHSWVSLATRDTVPLPALRELIEESHALVAARLPAKLRTRIGLD